MSIEEEVVDNPFEGAVKIDGTENVVCVNDVDHSKKSSGSKVVSFRADETKQNMITSIKKSIYSKQDIALSDSKVLDKALIEFYNSLMITSNKDLTEIINNKERLEEYVSYEIIDEDEYDYFIKLIKKIIRALEQVTYRTGNFVVFEFIHLVDLIDQYVSQTGSPKRGFAYSSEIGNENYVYTQILKKEIERLYKKICLDIFVENGYEKDSFDYSKLSAEDKDKGISIVDSCLMILVDLGKGLATDYE